MLSKNGNCKPRLMAIVQSMAAAVEWITDNSGICDCPQRSRTPQITMLTGLFIPGCSEGAVLAGIGTWHHVCVHRGERCFDNSVLD